MKREFSKNDFFTQKAKEEGYPARSVYKLQEIDEKFKLFQKGFFVLDLGAAPGSWLLYIANKVSMTGKVVAMDILDLNIKPLNNTVFIKKDVLADDFFDGPLLNQSFNVVVSDMAPNTTGLLELDVANCLELTQKALEIAIKVLAKSGNFVCKIFEGPGTDNFVKEVKGHFQMIKRYRPRAVRRGSKEFYLIAKGFSPQRKS
ncbi:MAG: RlmE family RNA methyltransferase [bacterium]|nr:RlmE family RNA methyltransferase [bacterium]